MKNFTPYADKQYAWVRFEREQARRERFRLVRKGVIIPFNRMPPQLMVRNPDVKGGWSPEIKVVG